MQVRRHRKPCAVSLDKAAHVKAQGLGPIDELHKIEPAFTTLHFADHRLRASQLLRQGNLSHAAALPLLHQHGSKNVVSRRVK